MFFFKRKIRLAFCWVGSFKAPTMTSTVIDSELYSIFFVNRFEKFINWFFLSFSLLSDFDCLMSAFCLSSLWINWFFYSHSIET